MPSMIEHYVNFCNEEKYGKKNNKVIHGSILILVSNIDIVNNRTKKEVSYEVSVTKVFVRAIRNYTQQGMRYLSP